MEEKDRPLIGRVYCTRTFRILGVQHQLTVSKEAGKPPTVQSDKAPLGVHLSVHDIPEGIRRDLAEDLRALLAWLEPKVPRG